MNYHFPIPTELIFEPINLCNAKCFCCPYSWLGESKEYRSQKMSHEKIKFLLNDFSSLLKKYKVAPWTAYIQPWRYSDPLVCPDLEMIFELADKNQIEVILTTNGVSFTEKNCKIIQKYLHTVRQINISIIGFTEEEIKEWMGVSWKVTKARLIKVKEKYPDISKKMVIGIKHKTQNVPTRQRQNIVNQMQSITLGRVKAKNEWMHNRMASGDGVWTKNKEFPITKTNFVQGCRMVYGKILRRMEVMVDGTGVLCCDDAEKLTNYGNVFELGIEKVWQNLRKEHDLIYNKEYSKEKQNLICNTCSRATFEWTNDDERDTIHEMKKESAKTNLQLIN
jgi:hypothetical protein